MLQDVWDDTLRMDFKVREIYEYILRDNNLDAARRIHAYMMRYTYNWGRRIRGE